MRSAGKALTALVVKDDGWACDLKAWPSGCLSTFLKRPIRVLRMGWVHPLTLSRQTARPLRGLCVCIYMGSGLLSPALTILADLIVQLMFIDF